MLPVSFNGNTDWIRFVGRPYNGEHNEVNQRDVSPEYFRTLRAKLMRGRYFTDADGASKARVVIINRTLARRYFPDEDPIGKQFGDTSLSPNPIKEIVGIVDDIKEGALDWRSGRLWTIPSTRAPIPFSRSWFARRRPIRPLCRRWRPPSRGSTRHRHGARRDHERADYRLAGRLSATLLGVADWRVRSRGAGAGRGRAYGVVAYSVSQRTREIGIRLAMGAQRASVYHLILREAARLTTIGILVGLVCAVAGATLMRNLLFSTPPWDVATLAAVAAVLAISALLASYIPARRAASVDPVEALRAE